MSSDDNVYVRHSEMSMLVNEETQTFSVDYSVAECLLNTVMFFVLECCAFVSMQYNMLANGPSKLVFETAVGNSKEHKSLPNSKYVRQQKVVKNV